MCALATASYILDKPLAEMEEQTGNLIDNIKTLVDGYAQ